MEKENISTLIEPKSGELDATDIKILTCLQDNSRLTTKELAAKVEAAAVTVKIKGGENGKTYGSVSTKEIAEAVKEQLGLEIDKKKIVLPEPIKAFGTYEAAVKLHRDVQAKLSVKVTEA